MTNTCPTCGQSVTPPRKRRVSVMAKNVQHGDVVFIDTSHFTVTQWSMIDSMVLLGGGSSPMGFDKDERLTVERAQ